MKVNCYVLVNGKWELIAERVGKREAKRIAIERLTKRREIVSLARVSRAELSDRVKSILSESPTS